MDRASTPVAVLRPSVLHAASSSCLARERTASASAESSADVGAPAAVGSPARDATRRKSNCWREASASRAECKTGAAGGRAACTTAGARSISSIIRHRCRMSLARAPAFFNLPPPPASSALSAASRRCV
eukprot:scaffold206489_cov28-Tisochrysis_lutea.AAC.3